MLPTIADLRQKKQFKLVLSLRRSNSIRFLADYVNLKGGFTYVHFLLLLVFIGLLIKRIWESAVSLPGYSDLIIAYLFLGIAFGLTIFQFIYQALKYLVLRIGGAKRIRCLVQLRTLSIQVMADRLVLDQRRFSLVHLVPAYLLSLVLLSIALFLQHDIVFFFHAGLIIHHLYAYKSIALINCLNFKKDRYYFEDVQKQCARIFQRKDPNKVHGQIIKVKNISA